MLVSQLFFEEMTKMTAMLLILPFRFNEHSF